MSRVAPAAASSSDVEEIDVIAELVEDAREVSGDELAECRAIALEALKYAVTNRERLRYERSEVLPQFVALLIRLQRYHHDRPFFMGCEWAAAQLGTTRTYVCQWWHCLMKAGFLHREVEGDRFRLREKDGKHLPGCASEWEWRGWPARESTGEQSKVVVVAPRSDEIIRDALAEIEAQTKGDMESQCAAKAAVYSVVARLKPAGPERDNLLKTAKFLGSRHEELQNARLGRNTIYAPDRRHNNPGTVQGTKRRSSSDEPVRANPVALDQSSHPGCGRMTAQRSESIIGEKGGPRAVQRNRRGDALVPGRARVDAAAHGGTLRAWRHRWVPRGPTPGPHCRDERGSAGDPRAAPRGAVRGFDGGRG